MLGNDPNFFFGAYNARKAVQQQQQQAGAQKAREEEAEKIVPEKKQSQNAGAQFSSLSEAFNPETREKSVIGEDLTDEQIAEQMAQEDKGPGLFDKIKNFVYRPRTFQQIGQTAKRIVTEPYNEMSEYFDNVDKVCSGDVQHELQKYYGQAYALGYTVRKGSAKTTFNMTI